MKKAVALLGTKRRQNTFRLLGEIGEILAKHGIALEVIELYRYDIQFCAGGDRCILNGECVWKDDAEELMERLAEADGVILASPVYLQQVSGKLKTFLDRTCRWYHRPVLTGKPMLAVASTKGSGLKKTLSYLESIAVQWGAMPAGKVGRTIFNQDRKISEREVERFVRLMEQPERYSPSLGQMIDFEVQKSMALFLGKLLGGEGMGGPALLFPLQNPPPLCSHQPGDRRTDPVQNEGRREGGPYAPLKG